MSVASQTTNISPANFLEHYFAQLRRFSVDEEDIISSGSEFPGNERSVDVSDLKGKGGVVISTGSALALNYGLIAEAEKIYVLDVDRIVTEVLLPLWMDIIARHNNRLDALAELYDVKIPARKRTRLSQLSMPEVITYMRSRPSVHYPINESLIESYIARLSPFLNEDIRTNLRKYLTDFFDLKSGGANPFDSWMRINMNQLEVIFSSNTSYERARDMILRGVVVPRQEILAVKGFAASKRR
jgi:hypothetical protein